MRQVPTVRAALHHAGEVLQATVIALAESMRDSGASGVALFGVVYVAGSLLALPLWVMSGIAGFAWGFGRGVVTAVPALTLGATSAFLVGRAVATTRVGRALRERKAVRLVDAVVRHDGRRIATLLRVSPMMPQNFLHFVFGMTPLRTRDFMGSTALGLLPMTCVHVYAGSLVHHAAELFRDGNTSLRDPRTLAKLAVGVGVTAGALALVMRRARAAVAQAWVDSERSAAEHVDAEAREQGGDARQG